MRRAVKLGVACAAMAMAVAAPAVAAEHVGVARSAITSGTSAEGDGPAVALLRDGEPFCSGVLVAPRLVLTAAHCLDDTVDQVAFGADARKPSSTVAVHTAIVHPHYDDETFAHDIGALVLGADAPAAPAPLARGPLARVPSAGEPLRLVGFGRPSAAVDARSGEKRTGLAAVRDVTASDIAFAPSPSLACMGDSGGPVLARAGDAEVVVGLTSHGDADCAEEAFATRIDGELPFVDDALARADASAQSEAASCAVSVARGAGAGPRDVTAAAGLAILALGVACARRKRSTL